MKQVKVFKPCRGSTLTEQMIVEAIVALLATVAYPSHSAHVSCCTMAVALGETTAVRVRIEQSFLIMASGPRDLARYVHANNDADVNAPRLSTTRREQVVLDQEAGRRNEGHEVQHVSVSQGEELYAV